MPYVPLRVAVKQLGLHPNTLRKYADEGKIQVIKNQAGQKVIYIFWQAIAVATT
jgi:putative resolvase